MHVVTWYHGTPGPKFTKFEEYVSISQMVWLIETYSSNFVNFGLGVP